MALWLRIVAGVVDQTTIGELPDSSTRLDTLDDVSGLRGPAAQWRPAAGWWQVDDPALDTMGLSEDDRALIADLLDRRTKRQQLVEKVETIAGLARDENWDWIDQFCHGDVARIGFVQDQSPNAGAAWGPLTSAQKAEALRLGDSWALVELIRVFQMLKLTVDVVADLIAAVDVDAPPDRGV